MRTEIYKVRVTWHRTIWFKLEIEYKKTLKEINKFLKKNKS
jgi:hypothetical protein